MGTAIAIQLARAGRNVAVLATEYDGAFLEAFRAGRPHPAIGVPFPTDAVHDHEDWASPLRAAESIVVAVSTAGIVSTVGRASSAVSGTLLWGVATKGWDEATLRSASRVVADEIGDADRVVTIAGPSLAGELARGVPTAMVCASSSRKAAAHLAELFDSPGFRPYLSDDVAGVEVGAALKNVVAIALGLCDGMAEAFPSGSVSNTKAFVFSRGLVEMAHLAQALGGRAETVLGLAGAGDLFVTAVGGRNARFGALVGSGVPPEDALAQMATTVEGYTNVRAAAGLAERHGLDLPIVRAVAGVLHEGRPPREAIEELLEGPVEKEL